jgi:hypothetical protein
MSDTRIDFSAPAELRKWPSLNNERVSASLGARPYMIGEGGTLDECIQQFMRQPEAQRHLYEIHTAPQSDLVDGRRRRAGAAQGFSRKIAAAHLARDCS